MTLEDARDKVASQLQEWNEGKSGPEMLVILDEHTMARWVGEGHACGLRTKD